MPFSMSYAVAVTGALLPHEHPNWKTVYDYFWKWRQQGLWQAINRTLRERVRRATGRTVRPSAAILDSQSAKTRSM